MVGTQHSVAGGHRPNAPLHIAMQIQVTAFGNPGATNDDLLHSLDFPSGIDVLVLPPGYTADDPEAYIFGNRFLPPASAVPEPSSWGSPTFGHILSAQSPRHIQFGLKLVF